MRHTLPRDVRTWKEGRFHDTEEETNGNKASEIVNSSRASGNNAPHEHA